MNRAIRIIFFLLVAPVFAGPAHGGLFDNPQNLKVLPEDITPEALRATMRGFAMGTGLRCSHCHVGEEGADLATYDFASDEKKLKDIARGMLRMVNVINGEHVGQLIDDAVKVQCVTCHRGVRAPRMTGELLIKAAAAGPESLTETYRKLRGRYYGTHSYDFSDMTLTGAAQAMAAEGQFTAATTMLDLILEDNPGSFNATMLYGDIRAQQGDPQAAAAYYQRAMELNPRSVPFLQPKLDALEQAN